MANAESVKIKQARRIILRNLDMVYPSGLIVASLYLTVCAIDEHYDRNLFRKDLAYLKDKGYVAFVDEIIGGAPFDKKIVRLTATGKEVAEGTDTDRTLEI